MKRKKVHHLMNYQKVFQVNIIIINLNKKGEFAEYINYTRNLQFTQEPDYNYLKNLFKSVMKKFDYIYDFKYDWTNNYTNSKK